MQAQQQLLRVPPAPHVVSQLHADYTRAAAGLTLSFRDYLHVIGARGVLQPAHVDISARASRSAMGAEAARSTIPRHTVRGVLQVLVLLVDFTDNPGKRDPRQFEDMLFSRDAYLSGSMREFFSEASNQAVDVDGSVHGWMRMPQPYSYYVNDRSGMGPYPRNTQRLVEHALAAAREQGVEFGPELDKFGNRRITALFVVHAGTGAEVISSVPLQNKHIWSHKYELPRPLLVGDDLAAHTYLTVPEDANMGVCAHELGHLAFQWDDFYDPDHEIDGQWAGAGAWDLMAAGSWNDGGNTPAHPAGLHKLQHGWVDVQEITASTRLALPAHGSDGAFVARIRGPHYKRSQALVLENRNVTGFDARLPGPGLLVWRIDTAMEMGDPERPAMLLLQADGKRELEQMPRHRGDAGDPFPGSANRSELLDSGPVSTTFPGQQRSGISLLNIVRDPASGAIELDVRVQ